MANKTLKTKIVFLNGSKTQWGKNGAKTHILQKGEPAVVFIDETADGKLTEDSVTAIKLKIGDGLHTFEELPYIGDIDAAKEYIDAAIEALKNDPSVLIDGESLTLNTDNEIQLAGFENVSTGMIPQAKVTSNGNKSLEWVTLESLGLGDGNTTYTFTKQINDDTAVWFKVKSSAEAEPTTINLDTYSRTEIDNKFNAIEDENTAHTHYKGKGTTVSSTGGTKEVAVAVNLNVALEIENNVIKLIDANNSDPATNVIASVDAAASFAKDGMLKSVVLDTTTDTTEHPKANGPYLVFTWNIDNAIGTDADSNVDVLWVPVKDLVEVYTSGELIEVKPDNTINHKVPTGAAEGTTEPSAPQTPDYGQTFTIPVLTTDKFGHVVAKETTTVKIPDKFDAGVVDIVSNDTRGTDDTTDDDAATSGIKITRDYNNQDGVYNIEIDDSITFILDGGTAAELVVQ